MDCGRGVSENAVKMLLMVVLRQMTAVMVCAKKERTTQPVPLTVVKVLNVIMSEQMMHVKITKLFL